MRKSSSPSVGKELRTRRDANAYAFASLQICESSPQPCFVLPRYQDRTKHTRGKESCERRDANASALASLHIYNGSSQVCGKVSTLWGSIAQACGKLSIP